MDQIDIFYRFGAALFIGVLVGLQREYAYAEASKQGKELFAGERTYALMGLAGCTAALASDQLDSPWPFVGAFLLLGVLITVAYFVSAWRGSMGLTTEVSALVTILAGALCYWDYLALAAALAVATTVLLSLKLETDLFVQRLTRQDVVATLKFAVITAIVLPVLPNSSFGPPPLDVLNPRTIWLMVVFISGISFLGYVLIKIIGPRQGIGLTGLLGGLASSTAVTLSFTQRSHAEPDLAKPFALAITVAWTVMFTRVVIVVAVLNWALLQAMWLPMAAAAAAGLVYCAYLYFSQRTDKTGDIQFSNPFELGPAIKFGLLYAVILLVAKAAQTYLGNAGVLLSSIISGVADVDAITISVAQLSSGSGQLNLGTAALAVVMATMSNTIVKGGIVLAGGSSTLRRVFWPGFLMILATGLGVALLAQ